jgi:hypothetical protein
MPVADDADDAFLLKSALFAHLFVTPPRHIEHEEMIFASRNRQIDLSAVRLWLAAISDARSRAFRIRDVTSCAINRPMNRICRHLS